MVEEGVASAVSRTQDKVHAHEDDKEADIKDSSKQFEPGNQGESVSGRVDGAMNDQHGNHDQCDMPPFRDIRVGLVQHDHLLDHDGSDVDDATFKRNPSKPSHPALHPSHEVSNGARREMVSPVILSTSDRECAAHFRN